jgi:hypothetical protein
MSDLLFAAFFVPQAKVQREASADNRRYRRVLRKRKAAEAMLAAGAAFESKCDLAENQYREKLHARAVWLGAADKWMTDSARKSRKESYADLVMRPTILNDQPQSNAQAWEALAPRAPGNPLAREAEDRAEPLRAVFAELRGLSGRKAADELNRRGIKTPGGGKWHQAQVDRVRRRLGNWP